MFNSLSCTHRSEGSENKADYRTCLHFPCSLLAAGVRREGEDCDKELMLVVLVAAGRRKKRREEKERRGRGEFYCLCC